MAPLGQRCSNILFARPLQSHTHSKPPCGTFRISDRTSMVPKAYPDRKGSERGLPQGFKPRRGSE
jgi:hypothetical protein